MADRRYPGLPADAVAALLRVTGSGGDLPLTTGLLIPADAGGAAAFLR